MLRELNRVIDYIEEHLTDDLSLADISAYAGVSDYHFRTVFYYLAGMTLAEYVKNRRLSEAGKDLLRGEKVTDVALKYGYESVDGFARAFKKWSGVLPSEVQKKGIGKTFPKLSFVITVKGGNEMECRIVEKPAFYLAGVARRVPMQFRGVNQEIVKLAQSITAEQREEMHALQNMEPYEVVNASYDADYGFMKEEGELTHLIVLVPDPWWGVEQPENGFLIFIPNAMLVLYVAYLFAYRGTRAIHDAFARTRVRPRDPRNAAFVRLNP